MLKGGEIHANENHRMTKLILSFKTRQEEERDRGVGSNRKHGNKHKMNKTNYKKTTKGS